MSLRLDHATRALSAVLLIAATVLISFAHRSSAADPGDGLPPPKDAAAWTLSDQTYRVRHLPAAAIRVDGRTDEPAWSEAAVERRFHFPWRMEAAPPTDLPPFSEANFGSTIRGHEDSLTRPGSRFEEGVSSPAKGSPLSAW
jgi:hypothetical protein